MHRTAVAATGLQVVGNSLGIDFQGLGQGRRGVAGAREDEVADFLGADPLLDQQAFEHWRHDLQIALLANPTLLPVVVEVSTGCSIVVDEVDCLHHRPQILGDHAVAGDHQGGGSIATGNFRNAAGRTGATLSAGDQSRLLPTSLDSRQRGRQCGKADTLARAEVERCDLLAQAQGASNDARVQAIGERHAGRSKVQTIHFGATQTSQTSQTVARSLHSHGYAVLVPVG
ncbi:hypothetical protein D3C78_789830 [compost metagenome]